MDIAIGAWGNFGPVEVNVIGSSVNAVRSSEWDYWFFKNGAAIATYNPSIRFFPAKTIYYAPDYARRVLKGIMPTWLLEGSTAITLDDY